LQEVQVEQEDVEQKDEGDLDTQAVGRIRRLLQRVQHHASVLDRVLQLRTAQLAALLVLILLVLIRVGVSLILLLLRLLLLLNVLVIIVLHQFLRSLAFLFLL
jgi:hypothetical protein